VIVATNDAVLVASRDRDQDVKRIVEQLMKSGRSEASQHARVYRPWGFFEDAASCAGDPGQAHRGQSRAIHAAPEHGVAQCSARL